MDSARYAYLPKCMLLCALLLPGLALPQQARPERWQLRMDGIGPSKVGMSFDKVNSLLTTPVRKANEDPAAAVQCEYLDVPKHKGVYLMFIDDTLKRVDLQSGGPTSQGIYVGDTVAKVLSKYPGIKVERAEYDDTERYMTVEPRAGTLALRFLASAGKVKAILAGEAKQVKLLEECN